MEFLKLYDKENRDILYSMSWLNKNSNFDKSIGSFEEIDLFTFLENISKFNYKKDIFYDDIYYVLEYTENSILHLINNINKEIKREHKIVPISQAKEFDKKTILWLSRQDGRTIREKLKNNKIKAVKRYKNVDTYENRVFKIFLKKLVLIEEKRGHIQSNEYLIGKIRQWLRSDDAKSINEYGNIVYNNILLHHPYYSKIFKSYKWLNRLNEKVKGYKEIYPEQIRTILKFEIVTQLQFKSKEYIFPRTLQINSNDNEFDLKIENCWLRLNLDEILSKVTTNILEKKLPFQFINKFSEQIITKQLKIKLDKDRTFGLNTEEVEKVYLDFFRLFPVAKLNKEIVKFPITLKQKINNKIVNANNTKIINLNEELFTLPEILKSYDLEILKYFLEDFDNYFRNKQLNYIIPDYVNIFEFSQVKKLIGSYFKHSKSIPKSILAGFSYIERNEVKVNDTLLYLQKNYNDELFVTPLLIKSNPQLKDITGGLYIERHPTRKIEDLNQELIIALSKIFSKKISEELISKFLRNGIKGIKNEKIVFYQDEKIIDLNRLELPNSTYNNISNLKKIYNSKKSLFKMRPKFISDETTENLENFSKISHYEQKGFTLWREHLPDLSMEIVKNGYFDKFVLVDENSRIENKIIEIKEKFLIPSDVKELSFPLYLDNQNIGFKAEVTSKQFPFKNDVECTLELTYDYERETPYELTFKPLDKELKDIKVKWIKEDYTNMELPIPSYPPKNSWDDFSNFSNKNGQVINLFKEMEVYFKQIIHFYGYLQDSNREKVTLANHWKVDISNKKFQNINTTLGNARIYKNRSINGGDKISCKIIKKERFYEAINIISDKEYIILKKNIRIPLLTIWNNGNSLSDLDVPDTFRFQVQNAIQSAEEILNLTDIDIELESTILFFLSVLHRDTPSVIIDLLKKYSNDSIKHSLLAYSLGHITLDWQKYIYKNIFININSNKNLADNLKIFAIVAWRYNEFIINLTNEEYIKINFKLYESLSKDIEREYIYDTKNKIYSTILNKLELLFALLRYRINDKYALNPNEKLTKKYIQLIDEITIITIKEKLIFNSKIQLNMMKSESFKNTPDLLYALRVYLSGDSGSANSIKILGISDD